MRVVLVLGPSTGGIGGYVRALAEHCVARGDQVVVVGPAATESHFSFTATGARFVTLSKLPAALRGADVVHSHGLKAAALTNLVRAGRRRSRRHVVTLHNAVLATGIRARIASLVERLAVRPADVVLCASSDLVQRATALRAREVSLCPVPSPPLPAPTRSRAEIRDELGVPDDESLLLTVCRLAPQKALPFLLDAVAILGDVILGAIPVRLVIAGDGPKRGALAARIEAEKLPVTLLGHRSDVSDLLAAADVFVLSSQWEARALVVQEAMHAGVPVVATRVGGLPELVGDAGLLVPANNALAFAARVRSILADPDLRDKLRAAGPARAATWPSYTESLAVARAWYT
ncbi:glycosyltransferase family 4 protein [Actinospica sp.]|jgi:glycosyltransferase involved in cell wall biosynthesis|uniref:glycosyltransferase family 4 protein n=1 Tax=Actinospica sp. TaxID=1872142 RepID=UPI002C3BF0F6|nr:glycosyltransferase family 4 protein [Actinospica sp.]HWG27805.1 glycosyltransferase family 4 protein [Actinospica sp.]